ncbi:MAG: hypothetical protein AAF766_04310 [Cyanobacteria bacterium P01_D01_bin.14]
MSANGVVHPTNGQSKNGNGKAELLLEQSMPSSSAQAQTQMVEADSLNRIRDILFGQQVRDHESQFAALELRLVEETGRLRADFGQQLTALDVKLTQQIETLAQQIEAEKSERQQAVKELQREAQSQIQALREALTERIDAVLAQLEQEQCDRTTSAKSQKAQLAGLFVQLAEQLEADS